MESVHYNRTCLPVLHRCDVAVIGGSFAGVSAALALARAGRSVVVVEPRTYLGREVTATLRPWVRAPAGGGLAALPEVVAACLEASAARAEGDEYPLHLDACKIRLEDLLLGAGARLVYASLPVAVLATAGAVEGVVIGNKSGRQVILCRIVIDATETALVARLAGAQFAPWPSGLATFRRTLEFDNILPLPWGFKGGQVAEFPNSAPIRWSGPHPQPLPRDRGEGVGGGGRLSILLHRGCRGEGHVLVECELALPAGQGDALDVTQRESEARRRTADLAARLLSEAPAFRQAYLGATSYELCGPYTPPLAGPPPAWADACGELSLGGKRLLAASFAGPTEGLWCLSEAARLPEDLQGWWWDPVGASRLGSALGQALVLPSPSQGGEGEGDGGTWRQATGWVPGEPAPASHPAFSLCGERESCSPCPSLNVVREPEAPQRGRRYPRHLVEGSAVPVALAADVLVVGGGSSGAVAAIVAAREGLRTALVDMNPGLGGTGTYGGIDSYWFGNRVGFAARVMALVERMHERLSLPKPQGTIPKWNVEAKAQALLEEAEEAGVHLLLNALVIGTVMEGSRVRGVVAATRLGPVALLGEVVIDATGDGDVAAYAGAEYVYGADRDHVIMYAYMPQVPAPGRPRNVKTSMVDVGNVEDYTRMILAERRRREPGDHDHGVYLAPRESRHIKADVVLSLNDQLLRRAWPDVVYVAFSNSDIKGQTTSDWLLMGLIPPNLDIEIPYRALVPKGLEGILVVGKAFSADHDALPAIRMQADLENLGGVAALAAAAALRERKELRSIDIKRLQAWLVEAGALPKEVLNRRLVPLQHSDEELAALIGSIDASRPLYSYSDMPVGERYEGRIPLVDVLCAGPHAVALLEKALARAEGARRVLLAQALAAVGSQAGVPALIEAIEASLAGGRLPGRDTQIRHAGYPPDQSAMPDAAYLLHSLGMARDRRALPVWQRVVDLLAGATEADLLDRQRALYYYAEGVCLGAERLGDPAAIPILERLHDYPPLHHRAITCGFETGYLGERLACLELMIGRALARCGSARGVVILIDYLDDVRTLLAEQAHAELVAITGQDWGKDVSLWGEWLEQEGDRLRPVPVEGAGDPVRGWGEEILIIAPRGRGNS